CGQPPTRSNGAHDPFPARHVDHIDVHVPRILGRPPVWRRDQAGLVRKIDFYTVPDRRSHDAAAAEFDSLRAQLLQLAIDAEVETALAGEVRLEADPVLAHACGDRRVDADAACKPGVGVWRNAARRGHGHLARLNLQTGRIPEVNEL